MEYFQNLDRLVKSLAEDPSTVNDPIKRIFVVNGEYLTANIAVVADDGDSLHTQENHDELLVIIDGGVEFKVGDSTQVVERGDIVFIPKNTLHGPILKTGESFSALSVFAPVFDRDKSNFKWNRDA